MNQRCYKNSINLVILDVSRLKINKSYYAVQETN